MRRVGIPFRLVRVFRTLVASVRARYLSPAGYAAFGPKPMCCFPVVALPALSLRATKS